MVRKTAVATYYVQNYCLSQHMQYLFWAMKDLTVQNFNGFIRNIHQVFRKLHHDVSKQKEAVQMDCILIKPLLGVELLGGCPTSKHTSPQFKWAAPLGEVHWGSLVVIIQLGNNISSSRWKKRLGQYRIRERESLAVGQKKKRERNTPMAKHFFPYCSSSTQAYFSRDPIESSKSNHKTPDSGNKKCTSMLIFSPKKWWFWGKKKTRIQMNAFHLRFWRDNSVLLKNDFLGSEGDSCKTSQWDVPPQLLETEWKSISK